MDKFFARANALLDRLESATGAAHRDPPDTAAALRWTRGALGGGLAPVRGVNPVSLDDLQCIDRQKHEICRNTEQFLNGYPCNNVLLWGPRGTGKSSLIRAVFNAWSGRGLRLVEVARDDIHDLRAVCDQLADAKGRFLIYCDDLSFEADDPGIKALKVVLDGSISSTPENVVIYATSNRRHLVPEYMRDNEQSRVVDGELHPGEAVEEAISLSERFGMWLAFHPFNQEQYLSIVDYWVAKLAAPASDGEDLHEAALQWALRHGSRSGRSAWLFARDWAGRHMLQGR